MTMIDEAKLYLVAALAGCFLVTWRVVAVAPVAGSTAPASTPAPMPVARSEQPSPTPPPGWRLVSRDEPPTPTITRAPIARTARVRTRSS
ncbi:MAG: hypothetical protein NT062_14835 [Proteobacteria bacterium]|nr:hypothetical protein [Pseudomonadota bacterium]